MSDHVFRNPDKCQLLGFREYLRREFPGGSDGFVVEDLDMVFRVFGLRYGDDDNGRLRLVELKHGDATIGEAQRRTFGLMDSIMKRGDPCGRRYDGYYIVNYDDDDWSKANFKINGGAVGREKFRLWVEWKIDLPPYDFGVRDEFYERNWRPAEAAHRGAA